MPSATPSRFGFFSRRPVRLLLYATLAWSLVANGLAQRAGGGGGGGAGGAGGGAAAGGAGIPTGGINLGNLGNLGGNLGGILGNITSNGTLTGGAGGTTVASGPRVVADSGILVGDTAQASVIVVNTTTGANGNQQLSVVTTGLTYQWTITGGKITTDPTRASISYVAAAAGTVSLNVVVTNSGVQQSATADVAAISPATAGTITAPITAVTNGAALTASVPPAQNGDRTFRWTVTGGSIATGQNTETITVKPGQPGLLQLACDVTLQKLVAVPLHAFAVVTGDGAAAQLSVTGGDGSGSYPAGSRVDIFANPPPTGQVFDKWTGDTAALGTGALAPSLSHAVVTVPATGASLTATYKPAAAWTPTVVTSFNPVTQTGANNTTTTVSTTLVYFIPPGASGVVFLLHDTGGKAGDWFTLPEQALLTRDLVAAGYGVAALNSVNRNTGAWNAQATLAANLDAANVAAALDKFAKDGALAATKPVFLLGMANGADAAVRFAELLATATPARPIKGVVMYCASGNETLAVTSDVPEFFALAANDEVIGTTGNATARTNSQLLVGRGVAATLVTNNPAPVYSGRFRALGLTTTTFTPTDAQAVWTALKGAGILDGNNYVKSVPSTDALKTALGTTYQARAVDVAQQLAVAYGAQEMYSDIDGRVISFLNNRVAGAPAAAPGRLVNLSTRTKIAFVGDKFALGFNISGTQKATLLIRGVGPALAAFGLSTALSAPHLEVNQGDTVVAKNDGWDKGNNAAQIVTAAAAVGAFALPAGSADTAVLLSLDPGTYTVNITGTNGTTGDVLGEVYDISRNGTRLTNLSILGKIATEGDSLVAGISVAGNNPRTLLVRAVGPGLGDFGIPADSLLGDPRMTIITTTSAGATQTIATNNNWAQGGATGSAATLTAVFPATGAFPLKTSNSDAALVNAISPGSYSLEAAAAALPSNPAATFVPPNQTGSVLVEVYEVP